jgi:hypothetical protein
LLAQDLLSFPGLEYQAAFRADYDREREVQPRVKLQGTLAKAAVLLKESKGDVSVLKKDGGLRYDKYTNMGDIEHFRVTQGVRVSCRSQGGKLTLYRYGKEEDINKNPYPKG